MSIWKRFLAVAPAALDKALHGERPVSVSPADEALVEAELEKPPRAAPPAEAAPTPAPAPSAPARPVTYSPDGKRSI